MTKKNRVKKSGKKKASSGQGRLASLKNQADPIVVITGKGLATFFPTTGNNFSRLDIRPVNFGGVAQATATGYQEFRFTKIQVRIHPMYGASDLFVGYFKDVPSSPPLSNAGLYAATTSVMCTRSETEPQWLNISRNDLLGGVRVWYQTAVIGPPGNVVDDYTQGTIFYSTTGAYSTASGPLYMEFAYECEFRGPTTPGIGETHTLKFVECSEADNDNQHQSSLALENKEKCTLQDQFVQIDPKLCSCKSH